MERGEKEIKGKILSLSILLLCLSLFMSPVLAKQPIVKEVNTIVLDGPFPLPPEEPEFYAKGVLHGVLIGRYVDEGVVKAKISMIQKFNIYVLNVDEAGNFLGTANMNLEFSGIVHVENDEMELWTGTYAGTWAINADVELPTGTYKGHITRIYREGEVVKEILIGEPPFPLP